MRIDKLISNSELLRIVAEKIFLVNDIDKSGYWEANEIGRFFLETSKAFKMPLSEDAVSAAIATFDINKDGKLSFEEIKEMLSNGLAFLLREGKIDPDQLIEMKNEAATKLQTRFRGNQTRKTFKPI